MANAEKSYKAYGSNMIHRYEGFPYYYDENKNRYYYGLTSFLDDDMSYTLYQTKSGDSYDSIAVNHYGCALYWWVICDFNRIMDAFEPLEPGTQLKLPSLNAIKFITHG